jgi:hypothetical protein
MAAGDRIFVARYFKHPTTAIEGVRRVVLGSATTKKRDPGDITNPGDAETQVTNRQIRVDVYGVNYSALLALLEAAAANAVIGAKGAAGANEKHTVKTVFFDETIGDTEFPDKDSGGVLSLSGVRGWVQWGPSDTWATMVVPSADS